MEYSLLCCLDSSYVRNVGTGLVLLVIASSIPASSLAWEIVYQYSASTILTAIIRLNSSLYHCLAAYWLSVIPCCIPLTQGVGGNLWFRRFLISLIDTVGKMPLILTGDFSSWILGLQLAGEISLTLVQTSKRIKYYLEGFYELELSSPSL